MQIDTLRHREIDPEIAALAAAHGSDPEAILEILRVLQAKHGALSEAMIADTAHALRVAPERAYGVASFYSMLSIAPEAGPTVRVCDGPPCWLRDAGEVRRKLADAHRVERTSCLGLCDIAPAALVGTRQVGPLDSDEPILEGPEPPTYGVPRQGEVRVLLAGAGELDPDSLESARRLGAYAGLEKALRTSREQIIDEVERSGLRGRGGAGFPVGTKWRFVAESDREPRYVVCNADESEPLVFKDRVLMDVNPHQMLEGMAIAGYAVGAPESVVYIRGEYETQAARLERAIEQAEEAGLLGANVLESGFAFRVRVHRGAGAYICGEETALLESLEGRRGEPRVRPPFPTDNGYRGMPTVVNNVETFAAVPPILVGGAESPRTKLYTLLGHVANPGLFEAPFGLTLREIIDGFGGGMASGATFQLALVGGAAGRIVPAAQLDVPIGFGPDEIPIGAGAILVCDESVSLLALLRELMHFFEVESCGKCTPCRIGTGQARATLERMLTGKPGADRLRELATVLERDSFCGLGISAAWPIQSAFEHFPEAFGGAEA